MNKQIDFYGLDETQQEIARDIYENNKRWSGHYTLEEVDADTLDSWIDNAREEGDEEYMNFLIDAQLFDCDVYTLTDHLGDFSQPIGEMIVY